MRRIDYYTERILVEMTIVDTVLFNCTLQNCRLEHCLVVYCKLKNTVRKECDCINCKIEDGNSIQEIYYDKR